MPATILNLRFANMHRNRLLQLAASIATLITAAGCTVDEDFTNIAAPQNDDIAINDCAPETDREIQFTVGVDGSSDGYDTLLCLSQFRITAVDGNTNYYNGGSDIVTSIDNGSTWHSNRRRYWPASRAGWEGLDFYTVAIGGKESSSATTLSQINFDLSGDVPIIRNFRVDADTQTDLLYSVATDVNSEAGKVNLEFHHTLCKVGFKIYNGIANSKGSKIISVEIGGIGGCGDFVFPSEAKKNESMFRIEDDRECGEWVMNSDYGERVFTFTGENNERFERPDSGNDYFHSQSLYMIPQKAEARTDATASSGSYIRINYLKSSDAETDSVVIPLTINWKEGRSYLYEVSLSSPLISVWECESRL